MYFQIYSLTGRSLAVHIPKDILQVYMYVVAVGERKLICPPRHSLISLPRLSYHTALSFVSLTLIWLDFRKTDVSLSSAAGLYHYTSAQTQTKPVKRVHQLRLRHWAWRGVGGGMRFRTDSAGSLWGLSFQLRPPNSTLPVSSHRHTCQRSANLAMQLNRNVIRPNYTCQKPWRPERWVHVLSTGFLRRKLERYICGTHWITDYGLDLYMYMLE